MMGGQLSLFDELFGGSGNKELPSLEEINNLIDQGAIFYISHSAGKDSQAMYAVLKNIVPHDQIVVVHADLGDVEWPGVQDHIKKYTEHEVHIVKANKTFLQMVEDRGKWPSASYRQCTSDLKRGPIFKFIRNDLKRRKATIAVNCVGIRAQESASRGKKDPFSYNKLESCSDRVIRHVYNWYPLFYFSTDEVFDTIRTAGQEPFWAYKKNERLSCVFCIMGCVNDLRHGAEQNPDLYRRYVELEKKIGHTMFMKGSKPIPLEDHVGIKVSA
ncbi:phosphoadenosine phosphosulfate reductase family protein [Paenibacillus aestuarii]|uniref:Phosphoadenosine phosphosulfate reductase family protein n=1 Tax=Paenibacillus aestuarii TaxID=516965 RepID=A0ABW0K744_9BACL